MAEKTKIAPAKTEAAKTERAKKTCPLTKEEFLAAAKPITVKIGDGGAMAAGVKMFSTGSYGFSLNGRVTLMIGDTPVEFQAGLNLTAIGSKPGE
jgi:hypothetical protein